MIDMAGKLYKVIEEFEDGIEKIFVDGLGEVEIVYVPGEYADDVLNKSLGIAFYGKNQILLDESLREEPDFLKYVLCHEIFELYIEPGEDVYKHTTTELANLNYLKDEEPQAYLNGIEFNLQKLGDGQKSEYTSAFFDDIEKLGEKLNEEIKNKLYDIAV